MALKPDGQAQGCILRRSMVLNPVGDDSSARMWVIIPLLVSENLNA